MGQSLEKTKQFLGENSIPVPENEHGNGRPTDINLPEHRKRRRVLTSKLDSYVVMTPVGHRSTDNAGENGEDQLPAGAATKTSFQRHFYYPVLDILLAETNRQFSESNLKLATSSEQFQQLSVEDSIFFINSYPIPSVSVKALNAES